MGWVVNATPRPLYPQERPGTHCIGGWVGLRAGLYGCGKSRPPTRIRSPDLPSCSESLYRLSYSGPHRNWLTRSEILHFLNFQRSSADNRKHVHIKYFYSRITGLITSFSLAYIPWDATLYRGKLASKIPCLVKNLKSIPVCAGSAIHSPKLQSSTLMLHGSFEVLTARREEFKLFQASRHKK